MKARWFSHVNGVLHGGMNGAENDVKNDEKNGERSCTGNATTAVPEMRRWLTDTASLTAKLIARSAHFRVQRLHQRQNLCLVDECAALQLARPVRVWEREVLLHCDQRPVVFAHTVVPLQASASDWPLFGRLGERSLGTTLFGDPLVSRGPLQYARLSQNHPLHRRVSAALGEWECEKLFARRCLYRRKNGLLLLTEVFLPSVLELD